MATQSTIPARQDITIYQGSPWSGVRIRMLDSDGEPYDPEPEYTAQVRTTTIDQGGLLLADCDVSAPDGDGWVDVTLDGAVTRMFPERTVYIDVDALLPGNDTPTVILKMVADIEGEITVAPVEEEP